MNNIPLVLAFAAGLLSFLSPCILPLIPAYVSYLTGTSASELKTNNKLTTLYKSLGFTLGFSLVFILMGVSANSIGKIFIKHQMLFRDAGAIIIILFGLHIIGILKIKYLYMEKRFSPFSSKIASLGSIFMGMAFAAGWTPCIGPILSSILIYASNMDTMAKGIILLAVYSAGLAVPFIFTALLIESFAKTIKKISKYLSYISYLSGILMILLGILMLLNKVNIFSRFLFFPNF